MDAPEMTRIHVLGVGSIGTLISHHLRLANPSLPLTLIVRNPSQYSHGQLQVTRDGITASSTGFDFELPTPPSPGPIASLFVALKTTQTLSALRPLVPRLGPGSVVTLLQNGMGVYDELCDNLWPDAQTRPHFILGTTPHGVAPIGHEKGHVGHHTPSGQGDVKFGVAPDPRRLDLESVLWSSTPHHTRTPLTPSSLPLPAFPTSRPDLAPLSSTLSALLSLTPLTPSLLPLAALNHAIMLKLAVNAVINALTAILGRGDLINGTLATYSPAGPDLVALVVAELSSVLTTYLRGVTPLTQPDVLVRFEYPQLKAHVDSVISDARENTSSMAVDVRERRKTEVDYINGYVVGLGKRLGVPTPVNELMVGMIKFIEIDADRRG
ncbi:hypothetical protein IAT38_003352 [Cryptococcus sp. DSM 104549]